MIVHKLKKKKTIIKISKNAGQNKKETKIEINFSFVKSLLLNSIAVQPQ